MPLDTPKVDTYDYSLFGPVEVKPLSRLRQVISKRLTASWVTVPHVTQFDEVDLTTIEALRQKLAPELQSSQIKLSLLPVVMKACSQALAAFPEFNASLDASGANLVLKKYCHIAFAADTPLGLLAPVVRDVDKKSILEIATAVSMLAAKAKAGRLAMSDAEGACFTVTNLGALGGSGFTPIINAPEVGVLGLARARRQLVEVQNAFVPRLILPLCLVYDHRVIDGAVGGRFMAFLRERLTDPDLLTVN
jgi:pyruvate dehydrogenase E2 component (dihydrolipoamide acetyltransferase)